jgi:hypothetical protein
MNESPPSRAAESPPVTGEQINHIDPAQIVPMEAARAHLRHWWREPLAGLVAFGTGVYDSWFYGKEGGLTSSVDEILVIGGVVLMAGSRRLFSAGPGMLHKEEEKPKK